MVGQTDFVLLYFTKLPSSVKWKLLYDYCSSFYGRELWDLRNIVLTQFGLLGGKL